MTAAVAKATADPRLIENLRQLMGAGRVITELSQRSYYSTDLSAYPAVTAAAVIQPGSVEELAQAVKLVAAAGYALIPRGGGMSYTSLLRTAFGDVCDGWRNALPEQLVLGLGYLPHRR